MSCDFQTSDKIALFSGFVSLSAFGLAWYALYRSNRNTSAATLVTLNVAFRDGWRSYVNASEGDDQQFELAELLNLFETACAIYEEKSLAGNSRELMQEYLDNVLKKFVRNEYVSEYVSSSLLEDEKTFIYIKRFIKDKPQHLSVTIPERWYQQGG